MAKKQKAKLKQKIDLAGLTPAQFLRQYWQKEPLLIRGAIKEFGKLPTSDEVAGLACQAGVESRLVEKTKKSPWSVRYGPFKPKDLRKLAKDNWTLLVQDVDKIIPEVAKMLEWFDFIPSWRIDDIMISYATDKGSIGAHVDSYDVFLLQVSGKKIWRINSKKVKNEGYQEGLDLRILKEFSPSSEWTLAPGDMLYLPPGIAHHGIAVGESLTYSIGFRAPKKRDLLHGFVDWICTNKIDSEELYEDPDLVLQKEPGQLSDGALKHVKAILLNLTRSETEMAQWFGEFITAPQHEFRPEPGNAPESVEALKKLLASGKTLVRDESSRLAFCRAAKKNHTLFVNGRSISVGTNGELAALLSRQRTYSASDFEAFSKKPEPMKLVLKLIQHGIFYVA